MKIQIVHPAHYGQDGRLVQAKRLWQRLDAYLPHLGPLLIAALTPAEHEVEVIEEYHQDLDLDSDADLVAISGQIMQFQRCVDLARELRKRGKLVVLGGYLPSMLPERVEHEFDAIVLGEGDELWPQLLRDVERKQLKKVYRATQPVDLTKLPVPRYDLLSRWRLTAYPVQATRGCPYKCQYCSIAAVWKGAYRKRPVEHVLRDLEATGSRNINFCDDNLCEDIKYSAQLFDAMKGSRYRWGTQTTLNVARHPDLLKKAYDSGCRLMALGVETLSERNLQSVDKTFHAIDRYADGMRRIMDAGISPHALIIFGLPDDEHDTFKRTVDYLEKLQVPIAQFFILTPYPGSPTGDQLWASGKVFDEDLSHLREPYVVYQPERLTPAELRDGWWSALEDFYSLGSIARRVLRHRRGGPVNRWLNLGQNLLYWWKIQHGVHPVYFGM